MFYFLFDNSISFQTTFLFIPLGRPATKSGCGLLPAKRVWLSLAASQTLCLPHPRVGKYSGRGRGVFGRVSTIRTVGRCKIGFFHAFPSSLGKSVLSRTVCPHRGDCETGWSRPRDGVDRGSEATSVLRSRGLSKLGHRPVCRVSTLPPVEKAHTGPHRPKRVRFSFRTGCWTEAILFLCDYLRPLLSLSCISNFDGGSAR